MYTLRIDKEKIHEMELVHYDGPIYVIDTLSLVRPAVAVLHRQPVVGFDTETRPSFKKGVTHKMALMQLATPEECFLFMVNRIGIPQVLADFLADPQCLKVGLSLRDDFAKLHTVTGVEPQGFVDLQEFVRDYKIGEASLQKIFAILFNKKISKGQQLTNWEIDKLSESQQQYAAIDAWACGKIYKYLKSGEFNPDESPYKQEIEENEKA
ncbi:MAG: 3'-5' exonuclease domain-containing protein 2 [Muribaculaceae bacterium]|nr:3'-5' exonuclease domain-containing protein 2 [Muribaculaceae bacterium]